MSLLLGVLAASVLGSVHCGAMCGPFVCSYAAAGDGRRQPGAAAHAAYNAGRLASYVLLGAVAGAIGAGLDSAGAAAGIGRAAAIVSGALMMLWGIVALLRAAGRRVTPLNVPDGPMKFMGGLLLKLRDASPVARAGALGLLTTLIPCGWLYVFLASAAATGGVLSGAAVMGVFWAGTLPMMLGVGAGARFFLGALGRRLPVVSALLVLALGALALMGRLQPLHSGAHTSAAVHANHG